MCPFFKQQNFSSSFLVTVKSQAVDCLGYIFTFSDYIFMKGNFDDYVLWTLDKMVQNWIVDPSTARDFTEFAVNNLLNSTIHWRHGTSLPCTPWPKLPCIFTRGLRELLDGRLCRPDSKQRPLVSNFTNVAVVKLGCHNFTKIANFMIFFVSTILFRPTDLSLLNKFSKNVD